MRTSELSTEVGTVSPTSDTAPAASDAAGTMGGSGDGLAPVLDSLGPDPTPGAAAMGVELAVDGTHAVEWVTGDIDIANSEHLLDLGLLAVADPRVDTLAIDCSQVTFFDSTGLGALIELRNQAETVGKCLTLRRVSPAVAKVLALTQLEDTFGLSPVDAGRC